jgi:hypothetical protein
VVVLLLGTIVTCLGPEDHRAEFGRSETAKV